MVRSDDHFLSTENPLATVDQREVENRALRLFRRLEFEKARVLASHLWRNVAAYPARDQMSRFDNMIEEYVFHSAMRAANGDAGYPKISHIQTPPHHWFGRDLPGSRWGGESPDAIYRMIPIAHGGIYELRGRPTCEEPPLALYGLMADNTAAPVTQGMLDSLDMVTGENGEFVITIDSTPDEGRANHLQTMPGADHLLIRDVLGDWLTQMPNALRVRRLDRPHRAPLPDEELTLRAVKNSLEGIYFAYYCSQSGSNLPPNEMRAPVSSAITAGLSNQLGVKANICLEDDEALIITANSAGARFRSAVLYDLFSLTLNYGSSSSSLNMTQMAADDDGHFTFVVAHEDPGIHNWLDTTGLNRTIFGHRWQSFPRDEAGEMPTISTRTVKFRDLEAALAPGVLRIDVATRRDQIARREAGVKRRFIDN
jgi:hypothetical protein